MKRRLAAVLAPAVLLAGCMVPGYMREVRPPPVQSELLVGPRRLAEQLDQPGLVVLHVGRDRTSYDAGHVPGARFLPLSSIAVERDGLPNELPSPEALDEAFEAVGVSDASRVVLYGDLGGLAAARAFFTLDYLGKGSVALLDGGLEGWRAAERPVTTAAPAVQRGSFTPRPRPELVASAEWVRDHQRDSTVVLVDARAPQEYTGEVPGDGVTRPGHIPGAKNVFWRTLVVSEANPELRSPDVLRALFSLAGARQAVEVQRARERAQRDSVQRQRERMGEGARPPRRAPQAAPAPPTGSTVVAYCRTGVQSSFLYFVSRYLGYETKLYDGSFVDWSRRGTDFPVER